METPAPNDEIPILAHPLARGPLLIESVRRQVSEMVEAASLLAYRLERAENWIRLRGYCPECLLPFPGARGPFPTNISGRCQHPPQKGAP